MAFCTIHAISLAQGRSDFSRGSIYPRHASWSGQMLWTDRACNHAHSCVLGNGATCGSVAEFGLLKQATLQHTFREPAQLPAESLKSQQSASLYSVSYSHVLSISYQPSSRR